MADSLENKILKWMEKEGYPLELKASKILRDMDFEVGQSIFYLDNETNTAREIDIVAYKYYKINNGWVTFAFVIECKSSKDKPWIAFTAKEERLYDTDFIIHRNANSKGKTFLNNKVNDKKLAELDLFKIGARTAFNLTRAFTDGIDVTYKATISTMKATSALVEKANKSHNVYRFFFPIILIDSKLFDCNLDEENQLNLDEITNVDLVISNSFDSQRANFIDLITIDSFEEKMKKYLTNIEFIMKEFKSDFD